MHASPHAALYQAVSAYQHSSVLVAAAELDCWTVIREQGRALSSGALAEKIGTDPRATAMLLDALAALGFLEKAGLGESAVYRVPEEFAPWLDSRHPDSFIPMLRHMGCVQRMWTQLAQSVKEGKKALPVPSILGAEQDEISFIMAMNSVGRTLVDSVTKSLKQAGTLDFPRETIRFLDVGGASGTYTQAFLEALPRSTATIFDRPVGIGAARKRFAGSAYESRVQLVPGDFYVDPLPSGFDFAWISAIIHQHGRAESRALYRNAFQTLVPGGTIAVRDFIMSPDRTSPVAGALFGINMLVNTSTGMVYTYDEVKEDLESAGFTNVLHAVPADSMAAVVTARKS